MAPPALEYTVRVARIDAANETVAAADETTSS